MNSEVRISATLLALLFGLGVHAAPLEVTDASRAVAKKAQSGKPATVESFGLAGYGYHSSEEEYVDLDTVEPRLYRLTRLVMDTARGK